MSRQGSGPDRGTYGRASDAAYAYQREAYLEADAYPVDPGYQGFANDRPRPADMPPGPAPTRPQRGGTPPRSGYTRRTNWQAAYDPASADREPVAAFLAVVGEPGPEQGRPGGQDAALDQSQRGAVLAG